MSEMWTATDELIVVEANTTVVQTTEVVDVQIDHVTEISLDSVVETVVLEAAPVVVAPQPPQQQMSDIISATEAYVGYALPGSSGSASAWSISRVQDTVEGIRVTWARHVSTGAWNGLVWDDRLTYTYV